MSTFIYILAVVLCMFAAWDLDLHRYLACIISVLIAYVAGGLHP